jgi:hypothetical protein
MSSINDAISENRLSKRTKPNSEQAQNFFTKKAYGGNKRSRSILQA